MATDLEKIVELTEAFIAQRADCSERSNQSIQLAAAELEQCGLEPRILHNMGHNMLICEVGQGSRTILLNGHLDVVAAEEEQFTPVHSADRLYGRGSYDMLASCAVMIRILCRFAQRALPVRVILTLSTTEETDGRLCTGYLLDQGVTGDFAICGEPTNLAVSVMSKGILRLKVVVGGKAAHSSRPWLGENALVKAFELYRRIEQLSFTRSKNRYFEGASLNLSQVVGGTVLNQVPDRAEMVLDIRYVPGDQPENIIQQIAALDPHAKIEKMLQLDAVTVDEHDPCLQQLVRATEHEGAHAGLIAQHGTADTVFFQQKGIPAVEFGPCGAGHHGRREYVSIPSLETYYRILERFLTDFR